MGRAKPAKMTPAGKGSALDLSKVIHTRVSTAAEQLVQDKAKAAGLSPATWVRVTIYRALGLVPKE